MARNERPPADFKGMSSTDSVNEQMVIAGSDVSTAGYDEVTVSCFADFDFATGIETARKRGCKTFGHMLDCDDAGAVGRHLLEEMEKRFGASGRSTDGNDFFRMFRACYRSDGRFDWRVF